MASVAKRTRTNADGSVRTFWLARYRDAAGKEHTKSFRRQVDARQWLDQVTASVVTGTYVDPKAGRQTFRTYAEDWRSRQVYRDSTAAVVKTALQHRVYPLIGSVELARLRPDHIQAMVAELAKTHAPATVGVTYSYVATICKAAVRSGVLPKTPCDGITLPQLQRAQVVPLSTEQVVRLADAMPPHLRALVLVTAGLGLRQGEAFGLTTDRVDLKAGTVRVDRQWRAVDGQAPQFGPLKTPTSNRTLPLPSSVAGVLKAHMATWPPSPQGHVFTGGRGVPLRRTTFDRTWRRAVATASQDGDLDGVTFHALRHHYASLLIRHGESVKTVQARLGHKSAQETLDTYSHLWPDSDARTREAVDAAFLSCGISAE